MKRDAILRILKLDDAKEGMEKLAKKQTKADDELRQMGKKSDGMRIRKPA